jgi:hypothetical protein
MKKLNEFNDEILNQEELGTENPKEDGIGSWDEDSPENEEDEVAGPEQDEESVLNADVVLAEPGLKQDIIQLETPDEESDSEEVEDDQKNTPQEDSRRVLSFSDYFSPSR